jgi:hypothetical protein
MSTAKTKSTPQKSELPANAFIGNQNAPTEKEVASALGKMKTLWDQLITSLQSEEFKVRESEWKCPAPKYGWSLRLKRGGRNIIYLIPAVGTFRVAFTLGKKAVSAAMASDLPDGIKQVIKDAPVYPEGRGVRFEANSREDIAIVLKLARFKLEN